MICDFDRDDAVAALCETLRRAHCMALVGAGASVGSGFPTWEGLLTRMEKLLAADDQPSVAPKFLGRLRTLNDAAWHAEELYRAIGARRMEDFLASTFSAPPNVGEPHHLIASLPFSHFLTTNFEPCIELALQKRGVRADAIDWGLERDVERFFTELNVPNSADSKRRHVVYLHGRFSRPQGIILTETAYTRRYLRGSSSARLLSLLMTRPVVFIGFSVTDPDLSQLLREVFVHSGRGMRRHFAIFGYRTTDERTVVRRRMSGKYGLTSVFYRVTSTAEGAEDHTALIGLLTALQQCVATSDAPHLSSITPQPPARLEVRDVGAAADGIEEAIGDLALAPIRHRDDPQKGRWGGKAVSGSWRLSGKIFPREKGWYTFVLKVSSPEEKRVLTEEVIFFLHDTFPKSVRHARPTKGGWAKLEGTCFGSFTVGAFVKQDGTRLELDLSELEDAPEDFRAN